MLDSNSIPVVQLARLSGLTDRRLRELAAEGWFPRAVEGAYQLVPTIQGLHRGRQPGSMVLACHRDVCSDTLQSVIESVYDRAIIEHNRGFIPLS